MDYYFGPYLRWSLLWETPNKAGAFLACALPWLWLLGATGIVVLHSAFGKKNRKNTKPQSKARKPDLAAPSYTRQSYLLGAILAIFLLETIVWFVLFKTYSRGALASALAAAAFYIMARRPLVWRIWAFRIVGAGVLFLALDFWGRLHPSVMTTDASVLNRLELWKGGLRLIAVSPLTGWGHGASGAAFMHWFQPLDATEGYRTLVSGWLTLAAEFGLSLFALCVFVLAWTLLAGYRRVEKSKQVDLAPAAAASVLAFAVCNLFSTVGEVLSLWIMPGLGLVLLLPTDMRLPGAIRRLALAFGCALAAAAILLGAALVADRNPSPKIELGRNRTLQVVRSDFPSSGPMGAILPDRSVLGDDYGKEIRRLVLTHSDIGRWLVDPEKTDRKAALLIACGPQWKRMCRIEPAADRPVWVHPEGRPPETGPYPEIVVLPGLRPSPERAQWQRWAEKSGVNIRFSTKSGQNIRPDWPEIAQ
jgi:hypothetical protein